MNTTSPINLLLSLVLPIIACVLQILIWDAIHPFTFLLFYPVILCSGWLSGLIAGGVATLLSVLIITWFFIGPSPTIAPGNAISLNYGAMVIFAGVGFLSAWLLVLQCKQKQLLAIQRELQQSRQKEAWAAERFTALLERSPFGISLSDSHTGQLHEANQRLADITGRTREELSTIDWMSLTHPDDVQEDLRLIARLITGEQPYCQRDKRYLRPDGSIVQVSMTIVPPCVRIVVASNF